MIADRPPSNSMGVGFDAMRGRSSSEAWKQHMGNKAIPARLAMLPETKPRWNWVGLSAILQLAILTFFIVLPLLFPDQMKTGLKFINVELTTPLTEIPVAPPPPPPPTPKVKAAIPKVEPKPEIPEPVKLNPQQPHIFTNLAPKVVQPKIEKVDAKVPEMAPVFEQPKMDVKDNGPKRPHEDVKTGLIPGSGSAAPATVNAPPSKVQTGGFGDPNGMPGKGDPNHATNVNRLGSPALPGGEGYGNGTGGKEGIRGTVASTGFGNGTATPPAGGSGKKGAVVASGFGAVDTSADPVKKKTGNDGPADTPVQLLDKPKPEYTAEGRSLKIEGDVVIDLVFLANGTVLINRVVSGLGHGLDDSAVRAAQSIRFKPAKRLTEPVDFPARVRIEFRLAY
ncbi:MAG TPA: TonB family protein [Candidatus Acidoferrum sp.]